MTPRRPDIVCGSCASEYGRDPWVTMISGHSAHIILQCTGPVYDRPQNKNDRSPHEEPITWQVSREWLYETPHGLPILKLSDTQATILREFRDVTLTSPMLRQRLPAPIPQLHDRLGELASKRLICCPGLLRGYALTAIGRIALEAHQ